MSGENDKENNGGGGSILDRLRENLLFFLYFTRHPVKIGAPLPCSRDIAETVRKDLKRAVPIPESPAETTTIRPILDWTDLDIWIYLHRHEIPVNPTHYREKQQRLVCIFCPDKDRRELDLIREDAPGPGYGIVLSENCVDGRVFSGFRMSGFQSTCGFGTSLHPPACRKQG